MSEYNSGTLQIIARYVDTTETDAVDVVVGVRRGSDQRWYIEASFFDPWWHETVSADGYTSLRLATDIASWGAALRNRAKYGQTATEYLAMIRAIAAEG